MICQIRVLSSGLLTTLQDLGRYGYRRFGVPSSGVLHPDLARIANALAGNGENLPLFEFFFTGPELLMESGRARLAFSGDFRIELTRNSKKSAMRSWRTFTLEEGDSIKIGPVTTGKAGYLAISGSLDANPVLGSYSTYLRGGFGGLNGSRLIPGVQLILKNVCSTGEPDYFLPEPPDRESFGGHDAGNVQPTVIKVIMGPQHDYFTDESIDSFLSCVFRITRESDRMGIRLEGVTLKHRDDRKPEIISDGIVPGAIQVPGNGAPIVLLADCQTVGGYPKIATVATVDLQKIGVIIPGRRIRFQAVTVEEGVELLLKHRKNLAARIARIETLKLVGTKREEIHENQYQR